MSHWEGNTGIYDDWLTPKYIFDAMGEMFDLDVAHPQHEPTSPCAYLGAVSCG